MKKNRKVLFIAAHPDDETLGCGGTILRHRSMGDEIHWLIISNMAAGLGYTKSAIASRQKEIVAVSRAYGFASASNLNLPTTTLDSIPMAQIIRQIAAAIDRTKAQYVYLPHVGDPHTDHQITHKAVISSVKSFRAPLVDKVIAYETISETEFSMPGKDNVFLANLFVDITPYMDKKVRIMKMYKGEIRRTPFPRSETNIKALATFRGSTMGVRYAEAFMVVKEYIR